MASLTVPIQVALSAAAGNLTILNDEIATIWVSSPGVRGTSDILWSCVITLTACVYSAIHLNVPPNSEGKWSLIWRKAQWVALTLFAPEIVLYCAYCQYSEARKLVHELNVQRSGKPEEASRNLLSFLNFFRGPTKRNEKADSKRGGEASTHLC